MPKVKKSPFLPAQALDGCAMPAILSTFRETVIGATITEAGYVNLDGEPFPCLELQSKTGQKICLVIQMDDEGNGPGTPFVSNLTADVPLCLCRTGIKPEFLKQVKKC